MLGFCIFNNLGDVFMVNTTKIRDLCKKKGIKQGFLCEQLGLGRTYFNDIDRGKNTMPDERIHKIAKMLDTSYGYLTDQTDDPSSVPGEPIPKSDIELMQDMAVDMVRQLNDMQHLKMVLAMLEASQKPEG